MIDEEDFTAAAGTDDAQLAFVRLESRFRHVLETNLESSQNSGAYDSYVIEYMNHTIAAARALDLTFLDHWKVPSHTSTRNLGDVYRDFITEVDHYKVQIQIARARQPKRFSVALTQADKDKLRHYVAQIKAVIDSSQLRVEKKEALYNKINDFLAELDRDRTTWERFSDLVIAFAHLGGEAAEELEPARKWIDSIARLLGRTKEAEDNKPSLPTTPVKKLEQRRQITDQSAKRDDFDDEIPF